MKVMTAKVVDGKIDVGDVRLEEGAAVAVLVSQGTDFQLTESEQEELEVALAEIRRGEYTDGRELLKELKGVAVVELPLQDRRASRSADWRGGEMVGKESHCRAGGLCRGSRISVLPDRAISARRRGDFSQTHLRTPPRTARA